MVGMKVKNLFFDRKAVTDATDRATRTVFGRFGAFVRRSARSSIRKARRKRLGELSKEELLIHRIRQRKAKEQGRPAPKLPLAPSEPGRPPRSVSGRLKDFIFFSYEPTRRTVVIGPARINRGEMYGPVTTPELLEEGGTVVKRTRGGARRINVEARPYMGPAFEKEQPKLPSMWANSVKP